MLMPTPEDLERALGHLGLLVCADTIRNFWSMDERLAVLAWAAASIVAEHCTCTVTPMPTVLVPFYEA